MMTRSSNSIEDALRAGERRALAKAITLCESRRADHRAEAEALLTRLMPYTGRAIRLGLSGAPGVGKSTFIEGLGLYLIERGLKVAVLAVDPSSTRTGGSILGDKTRMEQLARNPAAFIRPSPSGGSLGGVARRTREAMLLCEAAGFDVILIETVGVGQSETAVAEMVDMFLLLLSPGGGDELQGIKRGIMELADLVVVNKADGGLLTPAKRAQSEYRAALHLMRAKYEGWTPRVLLASALQGMGFENIWAQVEGFEKHLRDKGLLDDLRAEQAVSWMWSEVKDGLLTSFEDNDAVKAILQSRIKDVAAGKLAPTLAAKELLIRFRKA